MCQIYCLLEGNSLCEPLFPFFPAPYALLLFPQQTYYVETLLGGTPTIKEWKCFWSYDNMLNLLKTGKNIPNQNG